MNKLLSCEFNIDTGNVECRFADGTMISIDCDVVEDTIDGTLPFVRVRTELDWLIYNAPREYVQLVLNGGLNTHLKIRQCEFYKDYSWQPNAFLERATIEDTTVTYALVNPKTKRFTSQTAKKTEYRKATNYDNDSYILEKAYYCFEHNLPSYKENA